MIISESYKRRISQLSGIRLDEVKIIANTGRSDKDTLGFFVEEYLLNLGGIILSKMDSEIKMDEKKILRVKQSETKIAQNSLAISFEIEDSVNPKDLKKTVFLLNLMVKLESSSNTVATLEYSTLNDEFNLQSKHSEGDINDFVKEIVSRVKNVSKVSS